MSWTDELNKSAASAGQLADILHLSPEEKEKYTKIIEHFPMLITPYYLSLVNLQNPDDPIRKMCIPSIKELDPGGTFDTSGEASNTKMNGLQHKYKQTALLLSTNQCAMYCRHCFRKRLVGLPEAELAKRIHEIVEYAQKHKELSNVLISGGDAFMNPNHIIKEYLSSLSSIEHLDFIRFGSRIPVVLPERIYGDNEFLSLFEEYSKKKCIYVVTQFNHPNEVTAEAVKALSALQTRGVSIKNQTVLLRGVNDDPVVLAELFKKLTQHSVVPYYIFQCRPVRGVKDNFQVPLLQGYKIIDKAKSLQNGFGKCPRFIMSHPLGKIEIIGELADRQMIFKFHQNKNTKDASRIFTQQLQPGHTWLDENLNAI